MVDVPAAFNEEPSGPSGGVERLLDFLHVYGLVMAQPHAVGIACVDGTDTVLAQGLYFLGDVLLVLDGGLELVVQI